jgi:hypothetical protein
MRILNAVFLEMRMALQKGQEVEFPFGTLKRARRHFSEWWDAVDDWPANRDGYTVEWELDGQVWWLLEGEKIPPAAPGWSLKPGRKRPRPTYLPVWVELFTKIIHVQHTGVAERQTGHILFRRARAGMIPGTDDQTGK